MEFLRNEEARGEYSRDCDFTSHFLFRVFPTKQVMTHLSPANSEGYPGDMLTQIKYSWTDDNQLLMNIRASSTQPTPVDITTNCLMNLAGHVKFLLKLSIDTPMCIILFVQRYAFLFYLHSVVLTFISLFYYDRETFLEKEFVANIERSLLMFTFNNKLNYYENFETKYLRRKLLLSVQT